MAWPGTLDPTEQQTLLDWMVQFRAWCGAQARAINDGETINDMYNAEISALLAELASGDEIPNSTGYTGAVALTKDEVITIVSYLQGIKTNYGTAGHEQNYVRAAGPQDIIG